MTSRVQISDRAISTTAFIVAGAWVLVAFISWENLVNGAQFWPPLSFAYNLSPLFTTSVQTQAVVGIVVFNIAAAVLGYTLVVRPIWGNRRLTDLPWMLFAGVIPGGLIVMAFSRIVTIFLPNQVAPALILITTCVAALVSAKIAIRADRETLQSINYRSLLLGLMALIAALVFEVQFDTFHVAGEAILFFIDELFMSPLHGIGSGGHLPLVSQHYDEAAFIYPVAYGLMVPGPDSKATLTVLYWVTLAFGRLGAVSSTYIAFRSLDIDKLSALIAVAFFIGGSLSLNVLSSHVLFDSLNPLAYTLHVSRFLVPILPLLLIAANAELMDAPPLPPLAYGLVAMLGVGLSSMTIHVGLVLLWAAAVMTITAAYPNAARGSQLWRAGCVSATIVLVGFAFTYGLSSAPTLFRVGSLLAAAAMAVILLAWSSIPLLWREVGDRQEIRLGSVKVLAALCGGYAIGVLLLGNVLVKGAYPFLHGVWPWSELDVLERFSAQVISPAQGLMRSPYCLDGLDWTGRLLTGHCGSLPIFVRTYGLSLALMTLVIAWWLRRNPKEYDGPDHLLTLLFWGIILSLIAQPIAFAVFDFVGASDLPSYWRFDEKFFTTWVRSRLVEPWFYGGALLSVALFLRQSRTRERRWAQSAMMIAVAVFAFSPLLAPTQMMVNFAYFLEALTGN